MPRYQRRTLLASQAREYPVNNLNEIMDLGALQSKQIPEIRDSYESGWVGPDLTLKKYNWKSSQNSPVLVPMFWGSIPYVFCLYTIRYYKLLVIMICVFRQCQ